MERAHGRDGGLVCRDLPIAVSRTFDQSNRRSECLGIGREVHAWQARGLLLPGFGYVRSVFTVRRERVVLRLLELLGVRGAGTLEFCELIEHG